MLREREREREKEREREREREQIQYNMMMILIFLIVVHKTSINFIYPSYLVMNNEEEMFTSLLNDSCIIQEELVFLT